MEVMEAIRTRRSIRSYKPDPVDNQSIQIVLEAARWAPSWKNTQCWRFIVVHNNGIKAALADCLIGSIKGGLASKNPAAEAVRTAPVVIVACAELGKSGYNGDKLATDKGEWYMFDVALAMQNFALAAHSLGLGTVHIGQFDAERTAGVLKLPENFCVVEMTPLGYPEQEPNIRPRKELAEIVFYEQYGQ